MNPADPFPLKSLPVLAMLVMPFTGGAQTFLATDGATFETCSGVFYDSGGGTGDYADGEAIIATICPAGGSGSGPLTSISFTQWSLAPGPGDSLFIHDGTDITGPLLATGTGAISLLGQSLQAASGSGCLTFRWVSDGSVTAAGWAARITTGPDAGTNAAISKCVTNAPFGLFDHLGGTPEAGGSWTAPGGGAHSGTFDPASDPPGVYTYTVSGPAPCPDSSATITVTVVQLPNAGADSSITVCTNAASFNMRLRLAGSPTPGGSWTDPGGASHPNFFVPSTSAPGTYAYTVSGQGVCPDATAQLTVAKVTARNAGTSSTLALCSDDMATALIGALGGSPETGGTWTGPGGPHSGDFNPASDTPGAYTYTLIGTLPCPDATATVTVEVNQRPNGGADGALTVCGNAASFNLLSVLGGTPEGGGAWTGPGGAAVPGTYTPGTSVPGTYTYTVLGAPPCAASSATATIAEVPAPNAGSDRAIDVCGSGGVFAMRPQLNGNPQNGGTWSGPNGPHGPDFNPASDPPGAYTYTVTGTPPCVDAFATLTITVRAQPVAGTNGDTTACSTGGAFDLFSLLDGDPDLGGLWTRPDGQPHSGTFTPGTSLPGTYTYTVTGQPPCSSAVATVAVAVNQAPSAGTNASVTRCSSEAEFPLFDLLGGSPGPGGGWTGPNGAHSGILNPASDPSGTYTYTVAGVPPCVDASAVVNVDVISTPDAGEDGDTTVCGNAAEFDLFSLLGGQPDVTGTWTDPVGNPHSGIFAPGSGQPGGYTYKVPGQGGCADDHATVTVTVIVPPNAGTNGSLTVCSNADPVDLFTRLGGTPDPNGTWTRPSGTAHSGIYMPATQNPGTFTYRLPGTAPCADATASVQVVRVIAPNAGTDGTITVCSTSGPFELSSVLGGSPGGGGTWYNLLGGQVPATFNPGTSAQGAFIYVVTGTAPCVNDTAFATVNVVSAPDAGENAAIEVCDTDGAIVLLNVLNGTPQMGGAWTNPSGQPVPSGTYVPGGSPPGGYTYTVIGQSPCSNASAVVVVGQTHQPTAGTNGGFQVCSSDGTMDLFSFLGGTPDAGGTWTGPGGGQVPASFDPASSPSGAYTYVVPGIPPCVDAQATVTATVHPAPNAGTGGSITVCEGTPNVDLFSGLGGTPDIQGTWSDDSATGQLAGNFFITQTMDAGNYDFTYTVAATGQCPVASATVRVTIVPAFGAGGDGSISVCNTNVQLDLLMVLTGSPQPGGTWTAIDAVPPGALSGRFLNTTLLAAGTYRFRYDLTGTGDCLSASAQATVTVAARPSAGTSGSVTVCGNGQVFDLITILQGTPYTPGAWTRNGQPVPPGYNPADHAPGTRVFVYTVTGTGACAGVTSTASATVTQVQGPNPGVDATVTVCSSDGSFPMTPLMGGQPGGRWYFGTTPRSDDVFRPWQDVPGAYIYTVDGTPPCGPASATLTVNVVVARNAGTNNSRTVCSTENPFPLFFLLGPNAQAGGTWRSPSGMVHAYSHVYDPGTGPPGEYWYRLPASGPCPADSALVTIYQNAAPNAGTSTSIALCRLPGTVDLFFLLGGSPDPGGVWTDPDGAPFGGVFDRVNGMPGVYTYSVPGAPPCSAASSTVTITVNLPANAGTSNAITVCSSDAAFPMTAHLLGSPASGGTWTGPAPGTGTHPGTFVPGSGTFGVPGLYTYTVPGIAPCANATATLNITVRPARNAGNNVTVTVCSTSGPQNLFQRLGNQAQTGGTWTGPGNEGHSGVFNPASDPPGVYRYVLLGQEPCVNDTAFVTVVVNQAPNPGCNGQAIVCDTDGPFLLINRLGCPADPNWNWRNPDNEWHSGIFDPATDQGGLYTYTVTGAAPCASDSASVMVIVNRQRNAGDDVVVTICSDAPTPVQLFSQLGGMPDTGGNWSPTDTHIPGVPGSYTYWYRVSGDAPCVADSAAVRVVERRAPDAGFGTLISVCSDTAEFALSNLLGGTPDAGGDWTFGGDPHNGAFRPGTDGSGTYVYRVPGSFPCGDDSALVRIIVVPEPRAGTDGSITACLGDPGINLFEAIGPIGSYDDWGTWYSDTQINPLNNGIFDATDVSAGSYGFRYVVPGIVPCGSASVTVVVTITEALDAGLDNMVVVCEGEQVVLFDMLGGSPQGGGFWLDVDGSNALYTGPNGRRVFNTSLVDAGREWHFHYVLPPSAQCPGDTARVTVNVQRGPNAGCDATLSLCGNDTVPRSLFNTLGCAPDPNGTWFDPTFAVHGGIFVAGPGSIPGTYRHVVEDIGECPSDTAVVVVVVTPPPYPGRDTTFSVCSNGATVDLSEMLGDGAQSGGTWTRLSPPPATTSDGIHRPAPQAGTYTYRYRLPASGACPVQEARIMVTDVPAPNAGCAGALNRCSTGQPAEMRLYLGCSPAIGGQWTAPDGSPHGDFFDPANHAQGIYTYTVAGTGPCPAASATLAVSVTRSPNPGPNTTINVCITQDSVDLTRELGLLADDGGTWTVVPPAPPAGAFSNGIFYPALAGVGTTWRFRYGFPSNGPCAAVFSEMTVVVGQGLSPGEDSHVMVCGANRDFDLFSALGGSPNGGGIWTEQRPEFNAMDPTGSLDATRLPPGGSPYLFLYTVTDPLCGLATAIIFVTTTPYPDPGTGTTAYFCSTSPDSEDLFTRLMGIPDSTGIWTGPGGQPHGGVFLVGDGPGGYVYTVPSTNETCPDSSAVVNVVVNIPPNAGTFGAVQVCDSLLAMPLFPVLDGDPQAGGEWTDPYGSGGLTNGRLNTTLLAGGEHRFRYTVDVPGCGRDSTEVSVTVVSSVVVGEVERVCNSRERTYTVSFTITEGDARSYSVTGLDGTLSAGAPRVFTSGPIPTSQGFEVFVTDANGCGVVRITGASPCVFDDDVFVPQSFSPNGDGINDRFIIPGIDGFPGNEIVIFNRWGGKMFEGRGYDNTSVVWDGTSPGGLYSGMAPAGTYFYVLDLGNGKTALTGYLQLVR